jgi:ATP-binding cassette, subfamily B, bacterial
MGFTVEDLHRSADRRRQLARTPRLARDALRIVWRAAPRHMVATIAVQLLLSVALAGQLLIARRILEELIAVGDGGSTSSLYAPFAVFTAVGVLLAVLGALTAYLQRMLVELVGRCAFDEIVAVGSSVDYRLLETPGFYDQLQRALNSGDFRITDMVTSLTQLIGALMTTLTIAVVLLVLSPLLLLLVAVAAVPALVAAIRNSRESYAFEYAMTSEGRERAYVLNLVTSRAAGKEVRLFGLGGHLRQRYEALTDERLRQVRIFLRQRLRVSLVGGIASAVGMAVALGALVALLAGNHIDVATAFTAGIAMQQLGLRLTTLTTNVSRLIESGMFIDDYQTFLELSRDTRADEAQAPASTRRRFNQVSVEGVSFTYPGSATPALREVDLRIDPGEVVALVGGNGSGKTTLVKLICQLYRPDAGRVLWNGVDAATIPAADIASDLTVLFQDYLQYHLAAVDNVVFGRIERAASLDDAVAAARQAGAHEFLTGLPDGYRTRLGLEFHGGYELSVGQWQRLALARAFFRAGSFMIFDEPTAALDPRAERDLFDQMRQLSEGRSVLLISHRFSSARAADRIYVLEAGRMIESGPHDDLMALGGRYAELFELQAAAYRAEDPASTALS